MFPQRPADDSYQAELLAKTESLQTINAIADAVYHSLDLQTVIERALEAVTAYLHTPRAALFLIDESGHYLEMVGQRGGSEKLNTDAQKVPIGQSLNGQAIAKRDIVVSASVEADNRVYTGLRQTLQSVDIQRFIAIPLLYHEQAIGTLSMPLNDRRELTAQEQETLLSIGKTIGLAIANARYVEQIEAEVRERQEAEAAAYEEATLAEALREPAAVLNSDLDIEGVLDRILECVGRIAPADIANIFLIDPATGIATSARSQGYGKVGYEEAMRNLRLDVTNTPNLRRMAATGQPRLIPDTRTDANWKTFPETQWVLSCVNAPIQVAGEVIGFLNLDSARPNAFDERDAETLKIFADQAGIAIRNARLYATARQHADALERAVRERTALLEREQAQLRATLDSMADGVVAVMTVEDGAPGAAKWIFNRALTTLTGYSGSDLNLLMFKPNDMSEHDYMAFMNAVTAEVAARGFWKGEMRVRRKDGSEFDAALSSTRVDRPGKTGIGSVTIIRDISQEKALVESRARFLTHASHELRTPLTNLKTRLYLANRQPERMKAHLHIMEEVVDQMRDIVEYMLELSRLSRGAVELRRERVNLRLFLAGLVDIQQAEAARHRLTLSLDLVPEALYITADTGRINQVFSNLITNALHHTPEGGTIRVILRREGDTAVAEVEDNGEGIAPEHLPHIFQPFYRAAPGSHGTGLGLSIAQEIVERHGGRITATSQPGAGSRFAVTLPLA